MWNVLFAVVGCALGGMIGCGVDDSRVSSDDRSAASKEAIQPSAATGDDQTHTLWDALSGFPDQGGTADTGDISESEVAEHSPGEAAPADPAATLAAQVQDAGPRALTVLEDALESENISHQLAALDHLGARSEWDAEARHALEAFRDQQSHEGLRRRAADLLARHQPIFVQQAGESAQEAEPVLN